MAKVDINAVLDGYDNPRVGDKYEVATGQWGTMPAPTGKVRQAYFSALEEHDTDLDVVVALMPELKGVSPDDAIDGMAAKVVRDFFSMYGKMRERLSQELSPSGPLGQKSKQE